METICEIKKLYSFAVLFVDVKPLSASRDSRLYSHRLREHNPLSRDAETNSKISINKTVTLAMLQFSCVIKFRWDISVQNIHIEAPTNNRNTARINWALVGLYVCYHDEKFTSVLVS